MISGTKMQVEAVPKIRAGRAGRTRWAAALVLMASAMPALAFDLPALMALLGQQRSGEAEFSEQRFVRGLDEPLTASGTLSFSAPDRFVRTTLKPRAETMTVEGNTVSLTRGGRSRSFTLDAAPEMAGLVEAIRGTLTGNAQTVQRYFKPELSGNAEQWTLALTPLESGLGAQVRVIHIGGRRAALNSIDMELIDGDRSLMTIAATRPGSPVPAVPPVPAAPAASAP